MRNRGARVGRGRLTAFLVTAMLVAQLPASLVPSLVAARANALDGDAVVIATIAVDTGPTAIAVNATTNRIYVAHQGTSTASPGTVKVISGVDNTVITTVTVGANPSDVVLNESTNTIYVVNNLADVSVIDGATNTVTATLTVGNPRKAALDAGRARLYVTGNAGVTAFDTTSNSQVAQVARDAYGIAVDPTTNRLYVGNSAAAGTVSVLDAANLTTPPSATISVGGAPNNIAVSAAARRVFASSSAGDPMSVINADTNAVIKTIALAPTLSASEGLSVDAGRSRLYVAHESANKLAIIDTTADADTVLTQVTVGTFPQDAAVNVATDRVYVPNFSSNTVSVVAAPLRPDLVVTSFTASPVVSAGGTATYTWTITNQGAATANAVLPPSPPPYVWGDQVWLSTSPTSIVGALGAGGIVAVSSLAPGQSYTRSFSATVPNVAPGQYYFILQTDSNLQIQESDETNNLFAVPVRVAASGIVGVARCDNGDGTTLLPGATVDLYSGSVLVASTLANNQTAAYSFAGVAPNATYKLVYTKTFVFTAGPSFTVTCATNVTTDATGNATGGTGVHVPDRHNHTWVGAYQIGAGANITDYVFKQGQSTWFKIPIARGQRVTVKLTGLPADYSLALYKDIGALYQKEIAALAASSDPLAAVRLHDAAVSPDALSPDELSPDELSPDALSPDALSPDELSPDELSPDELSPDELSPDELSPDALSPDELSPDELSPDALSPDELSAAYAGAQTAALIGVSAHVGLSPEQISRNTWDNTGFFYMRVRGHNGAYDASTPFTIQATISDVSCGGATLTDYPQSIEVGNTSAMTLILTNTARLSGDTAGFMTKLNSFKARGDVNGIVLDLATWGSFSGAYAQWDANQSCPSAANVLAHSVKDVIAAYAAANPTLRYVVIAGNDSVIPFFRQPDQSGLGSEKDYFPSVLEPTASQASLRLGYVLTQDFYGSLTPVSRFDHELYMPDLAVGRLVETIPQMSALIDAYTATGGSVAPTNALVTGYDFLSDTGAFIAQQLQGNALTVDKSLVQPIGDTSNSPSAWTGDQLKAKLLGTTSYGILSLNAHFSANTMLAADFTTRMRTSDIAALPPTDTRFRNTLVLSTGCHSGYNIVDPAATALTDPMDWAQTFAARGATVVGGTGYQYGDTDFMKYSEQILANTTLELRYGTGAIPIGVALANAKRSYLASLSSLSGIDEKALAEATLYGLPMLGYNLPAGSRLVRPAETAVPAPAPGTSTGLWVSSVSPSYTLTRNTRSLANLGGTGNQTAVWYDINGNVAVAPGAPVLPQLSLDAARAGKAVRGAVLLSAAYADENATPFTDVATTEVRGAHARSTTDVFTPVRPFTLNHFGGDHLVSTPFQFHSTPGSATGVARRFTSESFKVYYSTLTDARALGQAPGVSRVFLSPDGQGNVDVIVIVGGLSAVGVEEVLATYTGEAGSLYGTWTSTAPLALQSSVTNKTDATHAISVFANTYTGTIPLGTTNADDLRVVIQAVGGNALVTWASNDGAYYRVPNETATASNPKIATALTLTVPPSGAYRTQVPVSATLTAAGVALANKPVAFRSGGIRVDATTDTNGVASALLFLTSAPGVAGVTVGFAEEQHYLASGAQTQITVNKASSAFTVNDPTPIPVGGSVLIATLRGGTEPLGSQNITLSDATHTVQTFTDGYGRVRLDTADGFPSGAYSVAIAYAGNDRYLPSTATALVVVFDPTTFVSGGGWFLTSNDIGFVPGRKATFGINLKYKSGTTVPTGSLELQAKESNVNLHATSFDWLAISGNKAEAIGHGTLNGLAGWSFHVTLVDGSPDLFSITIWPDTSTEAAPAFRTGNAIGGGSIVVH